MKSKNNCPVAGKCGGCQLQNMTYEEQLNFKQAREIKLLGRFCHVEPIVRMESPYHYRNKIQAAFGTDRKGKIVSGVYQSGSHKIVSVDDCMLEDDKASIIFSTVRELLESFKLTAYNEYTRRGFLRHVLIKRGAESGQIMVVLVTAERIFPKKRDFVRALLQRHPDITTVIHNINSGVTSLVLGKQSEVLYGKGTIEETLCGYKFRISAASFYQINPKQTEKLYNTAIELADFNGTETVLDAYCGTGTIGIILSGHVKDVIGVELNRQAVKDAIYNAANNDVKNIYFYCADAGRFMLDAAAEGNRPDVLIMDPPRNGSDESFLSSVCLLEIKKIVYISCNPETLGRDLDFLTRRGYNVTRIVPVDMFPHTHHVETVVMITKA